MLNFNAKSCKKGIIIIFLLSDEHNHDSSRRNLSHKAGYCRLDNGGEESSTTVFLSFNSKHKAMNNKKVNGLALSSVMAVGVAYLATYTGRIKN